MSPEDLQSTTIRKHLNDWNKFLLLSLIKVVKNFAYDFSALYLVDFSVSTKYHWESRVQSSIEHMINTF